MTANITDISRAEHVVDTVTLYGADNGDGWAFPAAYDRFHRITFDTIDGEPDCKSIKMEKL